MTTSRRPKRLLPFALALAVIAVFAVSTTPATADIDGDLRVGFYTDVSEAFIGGGILASMNNNWYFNPNVEFVLVDGGDLTTLNADFHYDFHLDDGWSWWLGAGPALVFIDPDFGDDETDVGANFLIGLGQTRGSVRLFAQGKVLVSDNTDAALGVGIRF